MANHPGCLFDDCFDIQMRERGSHSWSDHAIFLAEGESSGRTVIANLSSHVEHILRRYCYTANAQEHFYVGRGRLLR